MTTKKSKEFNTESDVLSWLYEVLAKELFNPDGTLRDFDAEVYALAKVSSVVMEMIMINHNIGGYDFSKPKIATKDMLLQMLLAGGIAYGIIEKHRKEDRK